jgi:hypothetical protein
MEDNGSIYHSFPLLCNINRRDDYDVYTIQGRVASKLDEKFEIVLADRTSNPARAR